MNHSSPTKNSAGATHEPRVGPTGGGEDDPPPGKGKLPGRLELVLLVAKVLHEVVALVHVWL
jgi:hypothetical protein